MILLYWFHFLTNLKKLVQEITRVEKDLDFYELEEENVKEL